MIEVRAATENDVDGIRDLFLAAYGKSYTYPAYYDPFVLKKMVFDDDTLLLVAEDNKSKVILGTASVIFDLGAFGDLAGEFGRLVVHPDARRRGIGKKLMEKRLEIASVRLHVGFVENRVAHPFSQRISYRYGFAPAGFLPLKAYFAERESLALYVLHFGAALRLRRNNPRVIPEVFQLAQQVLSSCNIEPDAIIDGDSAPYPNEHEFEIEEMRTKGYASLLRFERSRSGEQEIFGPARIHQGLFSLKATHSHYVIARKAGHLVGAIGFSVDHVEKAVKIFEIVTVDQRPIRMLIEEVIDRCLKKYDMAYIETDVGAYSPSMQRTLLELQFVPVAYIPAFAFQKAERCDVIRMARLFVPVQLDGSSLYKTTKPVFRIIKSNFSTHDILPQLARALPEIEMFSGLTKEQMRRLIEVCTVAELKEGKQVVQSGQRSENALIVLNGELTVSTKLGKKHHNVGVISAGECFGETALLSREKHTVAATAKVHTEVAVMSRRDLSQLIRRRPDIGVVLYKNLARSLGRKLRSMSANAAHSKQSRAGRHH
ncbi:MAG: GNAT family N-acetyltransferase [Acidobacteriota bacterium]|nr:GNAT family N-acetyltransferase [Acidobacteriota bacterium]MDH3528666.1 GNAT family N-acetyltransferase [Acidobacteriota bacterium]